MFACCRDFAACFDGLRDFQLSRCCTNSILYCPLLSCIPTNIGLLLYVMSTSSSLCTVTSSLVNIDMLLSSFTFPTLSSESWNFSNVLPLFVFADSPVSGSLIHHFPLLVLPSATDTCLVDLPIVDSPTSSHIVSIRKCPSAPETYRKDNIHCFELGLLLSLVVISFSCRSSLFIVFLDIVGVHRQPVLICALLSLSGCFVCRFCCLACCSLLLCMQLMVAFFPVLLALVLSWHYRYCCLVSVLALHYRHAIGLLSAHSYCEKIVSCYALA